MGRRFSGLVLCGALFFALGVAAQAAPRSLFRHFDEGYAVVYASVYQQVPEWSRIPSNVSKHRVSFRVEEVVAQAVHGPPLKLKPRSFCTLWITVGPGAMIDVGEGVAPPLSKGAKYFLLVKYDREQACYEHVPDSGILQPVMKKNREAVAYMQSVQRLARLPVSQRLERCNRLLLDARASEALRRQALSEAVFHQDPKLAKTLQHIWEGRKMELSDGFAIELDLQTRKLVGDDFVHSAGRCEYWLRRFLMPMKKGDDVEARFRNNVLLPVVVEIGQYHPVRVGNLLLVGMNDSQWSNPFRIVMLRGMLNIYRTADEIPADWSASLSRGITKLQSEVDMKEQHFLSQVLEWGATAPNDMEKRNFE
jgi:hypothetical protein